MRILVFDSSPSSFLEGQESSLTCLRRRWLARNCAISDFLNYLVEHQGEVVFVESSLIMRDVLI